MTSLGASATERWWSTLLRSSTTWMVSSSVSSANTRCLPSSAQRRPCTRCCVQRSRSKHGPSMRRDGVLLAEIVEAGERIVVLVADRSSADFEGAPDRRDALPWNFTVRSVSRPTWSPQLNRTPSRGHTTSPASRSRSWVERVTGCLTTRAHRTGLACSAWRLTRAHWTGWTDRGSKSGVSARGHLAALDESSHVADLRSER